MTLKAILDMAQYYQNQVTAEQEQKEGKLKELKTKVMMVQAYGPQGRGSGQNYGQNYRQAPPVGPPRRQTPLGLDQCAYCKEKGHWHSECPVLAAGGRGRGQVNSNQWTSAPRQQPQQVQAPERNRSGNYFDQQNNQYSMEDWESEETVETHFA